MSATTTYDVLLRYRVGNEATNEAAKLHDQLGKAHHSAEGLGHVLGHIGVLAGGVFGIHGAWESLVKFNAEVENAKISLTAMMQGGFGGSFQWARGQAEAMYSEFQKFSQKTPMTTQEMLEFGRGVAMATQQAGGSIADIVNVTEQGAIAAKAYGFEAALASREISEMLQGNIRATEPFTKALAGAGHKSLEELRAMTAAQRLEFLKTTLNSPALKDAVSSMSQSFSGVTSTLVDKLQILMGKIGLPLFKAITAEVSRWNEWIDKNDVKISHFADTVAHGLVDAFSTVKSVFSFIYEHADLFIAIGKTWAAVKVGGMLGGSLGGLIGGGGGNLGKALAVGIGAYELGKAMGLDNLGKNLGASFADLTGRSTKYDAMLEQVTNSMSVLEQATKDAATRMGGEGNAASLQGGIDFTQRRIEALQAAAKEGSESFSDLFGMTRKALAAAGITEDEVRQAGGFQKLLNREQARNDANVGRRDAAALETVGFMELLERSSLTEYQRQTLNEMKAQNEIFGYINNHLARGVPIDVKEIVALLRGNTADPEGTHKNIAEKPKVNVTIHRIEVASDDPDRFVFSMINSFRDAAKNPSSALSTLREG